MSDSYHREELRIALDPAHPRHILPPALPLSRRVLDVGCGAGQTLIGAYSDRITFGLDIDSEALRLGRTLTDKVRFVRGQAEHLPYPNESFDLVIARSALAYVYIRKRPARVPPGAPAGRHGLARPAHLSDALARRWRSNYRGKLWFVYIVLNSTLFHICQRQVRLLGKCESFQTRRGIARALAAAGFREVNASRGSHFLATAIAGSRR